MLFTASSWSDINELYWVSLNLSVIVRFYVKYFRVNQYWTYYDSELYLFSSPAYNIYLIIF